MLTEDPKLLARKVLKFEESTRKSGQYQKKLEDEIASLKKQLKNKAEVEELLRLEVMKIKKNYNSLESSYNKLNNDYITIIDTLRYKISRKKELSKSLRLLNCQLSEEILSKSNPYKENLQQTLTEQINELKKQLDEKDFRNEQICKNLKLMKDELNEQLKIAKASEVNLRKSLENLQKDFQEKENTLKAYDEKFRLAEESLQLFYMTVKYKEDEINMERLKTKESEARENVLHDAVRNLQYEIKSLKHEKDEEAARKRRDDMMSRCSVYTSPI
ncbi:hypothetical protein SteCoe_2070 [Stentor coeruleus]|uniref:Uncharacterized protein n=1 Tax=Stentor coeruleus TaxID=5963 RepID=A0A1R2D0E1_9CILI|nr:hypothetical protein SteCoe_2070 [Stentor coeruleus]